MKYTPVIFLLVMLSCTQTPASVIEVHEAESLPWNPFNKQVFERAAKENKLVLLHVGAQWCHWCHVMEDSTYSDQEVALFLTENFVLAKEDQDSRPDLFTRYRSHGWPAIILFDSKANEILKIKGYQEKTVFLNLIQQVVENPQQLKSEPVQKAALSANPDSLSREQLMSLLFSKLDFTKGGYTAFKKSLYAPSIDAALTFSDQSDSLQQWLTTSIEHSYQLIDPEWGGVFQYATHHDWKNAHFERLLRVQAEHIIHYTRYGSRFNSTVSIDNAVFIYDYCNSFLSLQPPLFNNSQDADYRKGIESTAYYALNDTGRRKLGVPLTHPVQFLKENAMMCKALIHLWAATGNEKYFVRAEKILTFLVTHFKNDNGLYQRSTGDSAIFSLDDNLALLDALILAHQVSGHDLFLADAEELAFRILDHFKNEDGTLNSVFGDLTLQPVVLNSSNMTASFRLLHLGQITQNETLIREAHALRDLVLSQSTDYSDYFLPYRLLNLKFMEQEPLHAVLLFDEDGTGSERAMVCELITYGNDNLIIERVNLSRLNEEQKQKYGSVKSGTLFLCTSTFCSSPITNLNEIKATLVPENKKTMLPQQHGFSTNSVLN